MNIKNKIKCILEKYEISQEDLYNLDIPRDFVIEEEDLEPAWGYGMTENGCILGAGNIIEKFTDGDEKTPNLQRTLKKDNFTVEEMFEECRTPREVLGISEYLLIHNFDISPYKELIIACINYELDEERLNKWISTVKREIELKKFKNQIENLKSNEI